MQLQENASESVLIETFQVCKCISFFDAFPTSESSFPFVIIPVSSFLAILKRVVRSTSFGLHTDGGKTLLDDNWNRFYPANNKQP